MTTGTVALVTGANQGLGLALVRGLCRTLGPEAHVYLGARDSVRGADACAVLQAEGLAPRLCLIDVTDDASVAAAADAIHAAHGGIDLVVSNAAQRMDCDTPFALQVRGFVETNNHGTYRVLRAFTLHLRECARVLVVASSFGSLRNLPERLWPQFDGPTLQLEDIERAMDAYVDAVERGNAADLGWPEWINIPSKIGQVASARILAREIAGARGILVNAVCPGLVDTAASRPWFADMSKAATPDQAAADVVWLATLPPGSHGPNGLLIQHRQEVPWK